MFKNLFLLFLSSRPSYYICSTSSGSAAFIGLSWTCLLVHSVFSAPEKREGATWKKMVSKRISVIYLHRVFLFDNYQ